MIAALLLAALLQPFDAVRAAPSYVEGQPPPLPQPAEGDFLIKDFRFASGETLPELRIHYRTLGTPRKNAQGS
jgi:homoserine O-acetyltransferase